MSGDIKKPLKERLSEERVNLVNRLSEIDVAIASLSSGDISSKFKLETKRKINTYEHTHEQLDKLVKKVTDNLEENGGEVETRDIYLKIRKKIFDKEKMKVTMVKGRSLICRSLERIGYENIGSKQSPNWVKIKK